MPWLLIAVGAALLALIRPKAATGDSTATQAGTSSTASPSAISNQSPTGLFVPFTAPLPLILTHTNRPTGKLVGGVTEKPPEGPSGGDKLLATFKTIVGAIKTAVNLGIQVAQQAGVAIASSVSSAVPVVGAVVGVGFGAAGLAQGSKSEGEDEAASFVGAIPVIGLVSLAVTVPKLFEGIADAQQLNRKIRDAKHDQAKSASDLQVWTSRAVAVSDRLDEWHDLGKLSEANQISFATAVNASAVEFLNAFPQTISVAIDHVRLGEHASAGDQKVTLVAPRDTKVIEALFAKAVQDASILQMVTADFLNRKGRAYKVSQFMQGDYLIAGTAGMAGYPGPWENPDRGGIIPGATTFSIRDAAMVAEAQRTIDVAPSLRALRVRMTAPRWMETFIQYYDAADAGRFHASDLYARIVQSRALDTVDALVPLSTPPVAVDPQVVQAEIQTVRAAARGAATQAATASAQTYLAQYQQEFTSGGG